MTDSNTTQTDAGIIARVQRFSAYLCQPGVLKALRLLYRHRVISRNEWLLAVWAVGSRLRETEPEMSDDEIVELMKQTFDASEVEPRGRSDAPCPYSSHAGSYWRGDHGRLICGVCHPPADPARATEETLG